MERILIGFLIWYITLDFKLIPLIQFCIRGYPKVIRRSVQFAFIFHHHKKEQKKKNEESTSQLWYHTCNCKKMNFSDFARIYYASDPPKIV